MTMYELAFQNYILVLSCIAMVLLVPVTLANLAIQLSSNVDRNRILQDYNEWRKGYNYQIIILSGLMIWFLHPAVAIMTVINLVVWYTSDIYRSYKMEATNV